MKVAVIIDTWFPAIGGGQINAWEISKRLAKKNVDFDIVTRNNGPDELPKIDNVHVYKLGPKTNPDDTISKITFIFRSFFFVLNRHYDVIHAHAFLPGITTRFLMAFKKNPAVFTVHGTSINTNLNNIFSRWLEAFILTKIRYSAQITVSRDFLKIKNVNKNIRYIPNGIDIKRFDRVKASKAKNPTIIFVGRLHPQKNIKTLISSVELVKKEIPNIKLLIIGEGKSKSELKNKVKSLNLEENVKFLGHKDEDDLIKLYKSSHLFILLSIYEGQPLVLLEAWAAKLPVIISKVGDCEYLIKNGENGYFISNPNDQHKTSEVVIEILKNENKNKIGMNGYRVVKRKLNWDISSEQTYSFYKFLI